MDRTFAPRRLAGLFVGVALLASACSGGAGNAPSDPAALAASEAAAANIDNLAQSGNVADIELLNVADGSISTLNAAIDGDRPVLLWFYSPH